jgi:thiamine pyrophosphate-dependent acetolactate synthase large subunit-like protein
MLMGELLTVRQLGLSMKLIVFNNGTFGFVEMEMKVAAKIETGVRLDNPDLAAMARAIGIHGVRVTDPGEVEAGVRDVLAIPVRRCWTPSPRATNGGCRRGAPCLRWRGSPSTWPRLC